MMLVIIGKGWLSATDAVGRRGLDDPKDFVRQEVTAALNRNILVTPVLVQGASIPSAEELPEDLQDLTYRNSFELGHKRWESDVAEMIRRLVLKKSREPYWIWRRCCRVGSARLCGAAPSTPKSTGEWR